MFIKFYWKGVISQRRGKRYKNLRIMSNIDRRPEESRTQTEESKSTNLDVEQTTRVARFFNKMLRRREGKGHFNRAGNEKALCIFRDAKVSGWCYDQWKVRDSLRLTWRAGVEGILPIAFFFLLLLTLLAFMEAFDQSLEKRLSSADHTHTDCGVNIFFLKMTFSFSLFHNGLVWFQTCLFNSTIWRLDVFIEKSTNFNLFDFWLWMKVKLVQLVCELTSTVYIENRKSFLFFYRKGKATPCSSSFF